MLRAVVFVALSAVASVAVADDCVFTGESGMSYDLTAMSMTSGDDYTKTIQVGPNIQFIYRVNVCANTLAKCQNQDAPATEALKIPAGETCRVLGRLEGAQYKEALQPPSASNPSGAGVSITYSNGDICDPTARTTRSVSLNIVCDENEPGKITEVKKEGTCATTFSLASQHACPATGGSTLSNILIIALVAFAVYLVGGFLYNMKFKELRGIEAIPNIEFWRDFPALVVDGVKFTVHQLQDLRARFGGGSDAGAETF